LSVGYKLFLAWLEGTVEPSKARAKGLAQAS